MPGRSSPPGTSPRVKIDLARKTHGKVRALADKLTYQEGRQVTFSEVIDILYEHWAADQAIGHASEQWRKWRTAQEKEDGQ